MFAKLINYSRWLYGQSRSSIFRLLVILLAGFLAALASVIVALASKNLFDAAEAGQLDPLVKSIAAISIIVVLESLLNAVLSVFTSKTETSLSNTIRLKLFDRVARINWLEFVKYHSGDLQTRMTSDIDNIADGIVNVLPNFASMAVRLMASLTVLFIYDPLLAVFAFLLGPVSLLSTRLFSKRLEENHLKIQESEGHYRAFLQERIKNMHIVKAFGLENSSSLHLSLLHDSKLKWVLGRSRITAVSASILSIGYWLGFLLAVFWGSVKLSQGNATFGTITLFLQLVGQIQAPFVGLAYSIPQLIVLYASAGRLIQLYNLDYESDSAEKPQWPSTGISAEGLEFCYENGKALFGNASFEIKPGETVAVIGASGEGKTTLIRLLLSLIKPVKGNLFFYDGTTGEKLEASAMTRSLTAYVPQGNTLFSGTLADNVTIGNKNASEEEIEEALKHSGCWDFINELPDKLQTVIGENSNGLSEGQAQRIAIARALLCKKPVLILDEATSALDAENEINILTSISSIKPAPTCIIITHRKAALDFCSRILKVEDGCITEVAD